MELWLQKNSSRITTLIVVIAIVNYCIILASKPWQGKYDDTLAAWFKIGDILRVYTSSRAIAVKSCKLGTNATHSNKACM